VGGHAAPIHERGEHEGGKGERDAGGGDAEAEAPANVVLDPRDEKARDDGAEVDAEVEPAEERRLALPVRRVVMVELLRAEWQQRMTARRRFRWPRGRRYSPMKMTLRAPNTEEPPSAATVGRDAEKVTNIIPCTWNAREADLSLSIHRAMCATLINVNGHVQTRMMDE